MVTSIPKPFSFRLCLVKKKNRRMKKKEKGKEKKEEKNMEIGLVFSLC